MKTIAKKIGILLLVTALTLQTAYAYPGEPNGGACRKGRPTKAEIFENISRELGLTPAQETQLKAHQKESQKHKRELFKALREKREALREELEKTDYSKRRINALVANIKAIQGEMVDQRVEDILEVKKILTPEQYAKFIKKMGSFREKMRRKWRKKHNF